jgi:hypothetical protein
MINSGKEWDWMNKTNLNNDIKKTIAQQLNIKEFPFKIYDKSGNRTYFEDSLGYWCKYEYDSNGKEIYFENSNGFVEDNRPKPKKSLPQNISVFDILNTIWWGFNNGTLNGIDISGMLTELDLNPDTAVFAKTYYTVHSNDGTAQYSISKTEQ